MYTLTRLAIIDALVKLRTNGIVVRRESIGRKLELLFRTRRRGDPYLTTVEHFELVAVVLGAASFLAPIIGYLFLFRLIPWIVDGFK